MMLVKKRLVLYRLFLIKKVMKCLLIKHVNVTDIVIFGTVSDL